MRPVSYWLRQFLININLQRLLTLNWRFKEERPQASIVEHVNLDIGAEQYCQTADLLKYNWLSGRGMTGRGRGCLDLISDPVALSMPAWMLVLYCIFYSQDFETEIKSPSWKVIFFPDCVFITNCLQLLELLELDCGQTVKFPFPCPLGTECSQF